MYQEVEKDDNNIISYNKLLKIFEDYKVGITSKDDRDTFMQAFVANSDR